MATAVTCPKCGTTYQLRDSLAASRKAQCTKCGVSFTITPTTAGSTPSPRPAPPESAAGEYPSHGAGKTGSAGSETTARRSLKGSRLGGCRIERLLGKGGMGAVYRGHHEALDIPVAVKVLPPRFAKANQTLIERFIREARAAARIKHHNIIGVLNVGEERGLHFIVMEYVDGSSVERLLRTQGRLPVETVLDIGVQVCAALAAAHRAQIVHRDIKPDNIMLAVDGTVKLADLGLAKSLEEDAGLTQSGMTMGTPHYIAPEQADDASCADYRSDIYSLGCTLYRMLTGTPPYEGTSLYNIIKQHANAPVPDIRGAVPELSEPLAQVIAQAMAKEPRERYATAEALLADLKAILEQRPPLNLTSPGAAAPTVKMKRPRAAGRPSGSRPPKQARSLLLLSGGAALVVLLLWALWPRALRLHVASPQSKATTEDPAMPAGAGTSVSAPSPASQAEGDTNSPAPPEPQQAPRPPTPMPQAPAEAPQKDPVAAPADPELQAVEELLKTDAGAVGEYEILKQLPHSPMGRLYAARHRTRALPVILSVVTKPGFLQTPAGKQFRQVLDLLHGIAHPSLPAVYEARTIGPYLLSASRPLPGHTVACSEAIRNRRNQAEAADLEGLLKKIAEVMQVYHRHGIVHRNLQPASLRLGPDGRVYVWSFGQAARTGEDAVTPKDTRLGQPQYRAPEQWDRNAVDIRADLYSLGAILYEAFAGQPPHAGTEGEIKRQIAQPNATPVALQVRDPTLPKGVSRCIMKLLAKNPEKRFRTPRELILVLELAEKAREHFGRKRESENRQPRQWRPRPDTRDAPSR